MSLKLLARNADLKRLRDDGYDVSIESSYLIVRRVPYLGDGGALKYGAFVSELTLAGDRTVRPNTHVVFFDGDFPRDKFGTTIEAIRHQTVLQQLAPGLAVQHSFSNKPAAGYENFFDKMTTYIAIVSNEATALHPNVSARSNSRVIETYEDESVFAYLDTASSRAGIVPASRKLERGKVAIIGLGGTGSYVLDQIAKVPVDEIHLFDRDILQSHNAFRAPGAADIGVLRSEPKKVEYFATLYSRMHKHIVPHDVNIDEGNVAALDGFDFVFVCMDRGALKRVLIERLEEKKIAYIDVGMGLYMSDDTIGGIVRTVTSTETQRRHVWDQQRISFQDNEHDNLYSRNIQVADLNMLNAALAVIKWKKLRGFYFDLSHEHFSAYAIDGNRLANEDVNVAS